MLSGTSSHAPLVRLVLLCSRTRGPPFQDTVTWTSNPSQTRLKATGPKSATRSKYSTGKVWSELAKVNARLSPVSQVPPLRTNLNGTEPPGETLLILTVPT